MTARKQVEDATKATTAKRAATLGSAAMTAGMNAHGVIPVTPTEEEETVAATLAAVIVATGATNVISHANTAATAVAGTRDVLRLTPWKQSAAAPGLATADARGQSLQGAALQGAATAGAALLSAHRGLL